MDRGQERVDPGDAFLRENNSPTRQTLRKPEHLQTDVELTHESVTVRERSVWRTGGAFE